MLDGVKLFVAVVLGFNVLALAFFTLRALRRPELWRVVYRDGDFQSIWMSKRDALTHYQTWRDAEAIESQFGKVERPRRICVGQLPGDL